MIGFLAVALVVLTVEPPERRVLRSPPGEMTSERVPREEEAPPDNLLAALVVEEIEGRDL
jgi:hypothetical protein